MVAIRQCVEVILFFRATIVDKILSLKCLQRTHSGGNLFRFDQCGKKSRKDNLLIHQRAHSGERQVKCDQCNESFTIKANYVNH